MSYQIAAIEGPTIQGEGPHAGRPCLLLRLATCNAWNGEPSSRAASACPYCDTDFRPTARLGLGELLAQLETRRAGSPKAGLILTGGEPLLQANVALIEALCEAFPWVDLETNGTRPLPAHPHTLTVVCSPKHIPEQPIVIEPDCWKLLVPVQERFLEHCLASGLPLYLQPVMPENGHDDPAYRANILRCLEHAHRHGGIVSVQLHKMLGLP